MKKIILSFVCVFFMISSFSQLTLRIESKKGKYGLIQYKTWKVKPRYDEIIEVSEDCYVLRNKDIYRIYYRGSYKKNRYKLDKNSYTTFDHNGGSIFSMADKKGLFAIFNDRGNRQTDFLYQQVIIKKRYALYRTNTHSAWGMYDASAFYHSKNDFTADSLYLLPHATIAISYHDAYTVNIIHENATISRGIHYNPLMGKEKIMIENERGEKAIMDENGELKTTWMRNIETLPNGTYKFKENHYEGIMDKDGKVIIPAKNTYVAVDGNNFWIRQGKRDYRLYDLQGKEILSCTSWEKITTGVYDIYTDYDHIIYYAHTGTKEWGVEDVYKPVDGIMRVQKKTGYFYSDTLGIKRSQDFPYVYVQVTRHSAGETFMGLVKMFLVVPAVMDIATGEDIFGEGHAATDRLEGSDFRSGMAKIVYTDSAKHIRYGYIDTSLQMVLEPNYEEIRGFYGNIAFVRKKDAWAIMNKKGEILTGFIYSDVDFFNDGLFIVRKKGQYDYIIINEKGERTEHPAFGSYSHNAADHTVSLYINHKYYILKQNGELVPE